MEAEHVLIVKWRQKISNTFFITSMLKISITHHQRKSFSRNNIKQFACFKKCPEICEKYMFNISDKLSSFWWKKTSIPKSSLHNLCLTLWHKHMHLLAKIVARVERKRAVTFLEWNTFSSLFCILLWLKTDFQFTINNFVFISECQQCRPRYFQCFTNRKCPRKETIQYGAKFGEKCHYKILMWFQTYLLVLPTEILKISLCKYKLSNYWYIAFTLIFT
jgi:hypothetical protein